MGTPSFAEVLREQLDAAPPAPDRTYSGRAPWQDLTRTWRRVEIDDRAAGPQAQGIAHPHSAVPQCFHLLGLSSASSLQEVKRAFRARALQTHPDHRGGSHEAFLAIVRAYQQACELVTAQAA